MAHILDDGRHIFFMINSTVFTIHNLL